MLSQEWILVIFLITGSVTAMVPVPVHHMADELLRNGPDTVIRKQRSLIRILNTTMTFVRSNITEERGRESSIGNTKEKGK